MGLENRFIIPVKIDAIKLSDQRAVGTGLKTGAWFEACREFDSLGTYRGDISLKAENFYNFVRNFRAAVYRRNLTADKKQTLKIDYDHYMDSAKGYEAAGWVVDVDVRDKTLSDGTITRSLWLLPEWTPEAEMRIRDGKYKYFSIEFNSEWYDDQNGNIVKDLLVGGALTNDPFVMDLLPIALSNLVGLRKADAEKAGAEAEKKQKEAEQMKKILSVLSAAGVKLSENASEEDVQKGIAEVIDKKDAAEKAVEDVRSELSATESKVTSLTKTVEELSAKMAAYVEAEKVAKVEKFNAWKKDISDRAVESMKFSAAEVKEDGELGAMLIEGKEDAAEAVLKFAAVRFAKAEGNSAEGSAEELSESALIKKVMTEKNVDALSARDIIVKEKLKFKKEA